MLLKIGPKRFIFNMPGTLKQLWNADTIYFRVLFQFYFKDQSVFETQCGDVEAQRPESGAILHMRHAIKSATRRACAPGL